MYVPIHSPSDDQKEGRSKMVFVAFIIFIIFMIGIFAFIYFFLYK